MNPVTHFLTGWTAANTVNLERRDRMLVALAGISPDADGLGVVADFVLQRFNPAHKFEYYQQFHHVFGHNIFFALAVATVGLAFGVRKRFVALMMLVSLHLHFLGDILGGRGLEDDFWPAPYFWPASNLELVWKGQWPLDGWQNISFTIVLLTLAFYLAWKRGYSPVEILSRKADQAFVDVLRKRFGAVNEA